MTVCYFHKNGHKYQWNRIESPEIYPPIMSIDFFDKGAKAAQGRKKSLFSK